MYKFSILLLVFISTSILANPKGFNEPSGTYNYPQGFDHVKPKKNTILGLLKYGKDGDYILLEGSFVKKQDDYYILQDSNNNTIKMKLPENIAPPVFDVPYYTWGNVKKGFLDTYIEIIFISPK